MIEQLELQHYGMHHTLVWNKLGRINLLVGENGTGKTFIMKSMYTVLKALEQYKKGQDKQSLTDILAEKLYWTFQPESLGDLVNKEDKERLRFLMRIDGKKISYEFGRDTVKKIIKLDSELQENRTDKSIYIPAKGVLSLYPIILKSREQDQIFGFDDTYLDLVRALMQPSQKGNNYQGFSKSRDFLRDLIGGRVDFDDKTGAWYYFQGKNHYTIGETAEGIKKIAIFDRLLGNRYLNRNAIVFFDELESSLHPKAVVKFLDIIYMLAQSGLQFFIASHSYFTIKKLCLMAKKYNESIPVISLSADCDPVIEDLRDGMPDNSIINEAIALYEAETDFLMGE